MHHVVDVPIFKRCPACWKTDRGVGEIQGSRMVEYVGQRRHYRCRECGTSWPAVIEQIATVSPEHVKAVT